MIDRIVATVNGHIILQSDWNDALRYEALLSGRSLSLFSEEDRRSVLDRLIDQELLAEQMKSASFSHASESEAQAQIADARKQYPEAATDEGWQQILDRYGLTQMQWSLMFSNRLTCCGWWMRTSAPQFKSIPSPWKPITATSSSRS